MSPTIHSNIPRSVSSPTAAASASAAEKPAAASATAAPSGSGKSHATDTFAQAAVSSAMPNISGAASTAQTGAEGAAMLAQQQAADKQAEQIALQASLEKSRHDAMMSIINKM